MLTHLHRNFKAESENKELGLEYMKMAAYGNDRKAMLFLAKACETGVGLPDNRYLPFY